MENNMTNRVKPTALITFIILFLIPLSGMGIDIYAPSLPAITHHFTIASSTAKLTIPIYIFSYGIAMLFYGPITDAIGRKNLVIAGLILYILAALSCAFAPNIAWLLVSRALLGIFVAAPMITSRTLMTDCYEGKKFSDLTNWSVVCWGMGPILAPVIGGYLQTYFNWRYPFLFLAAYVLVALLIIIFAIPETLTNKTPLNPKKMVINYKTMATNKVFLVSVIIMGSIYSIMTTFNVVGPFLIQTVLKQSAVTFGHIALILGLAWFAGQLSNRYLALKFAFKKIVWFYFSIVTIGLALMLYFALMQQLNLFTVVLPTAIIFYGAAPIFPNLYGKTLAYFKHMAGAASALIGAFFIIISAISAAIGSYLNASSIMPLSIYYLVMLVIIIGLFVAVLVPHYRRQPS